MNLLTILFYLYCFIAVMAFLCLCLLSYPRNVTRSIASDVITLLLAITIAFLLYIESTKIC